MKIFNNLLKKILFFISLIIFIALVIFNHNVVSLSLFGFKTIEIPLFFVIFGSFFLGALASLIYFIFRKK